MWQVGWGNWFLWLREIFQLVNYCKRDFIIWFAVNNCSGGSAFDLIFKYFKANFLKLFFIFILFLLSEPSAAEKKAQEMIFKKQEACQKCLAEKYCTLVLGLNTKKYHHLGCGRFDIYFMFPFFLFLFCFVFWHCYCVTSSRPSFFTQIGVCIYDILRRLSYFLHLWV